MPEPSSGGSSMALIHEGWDHLRAGRPLAAWASWQRALRREGGSTAAAQAMATLESAADLPAAARAVYRLRTPSDPARRAAWNERLRGPAIGPTHAADGDANGHGGPGTADLADMADAFGRLAMEGTPDPAAWFNRALCLAWLGSNREAVSCLERAVELEAGPAPDRAVEAWTLAEVLRQGGGAADLADDLRFACTIDWDPADTATLLAEFPGSSGCRLRGPPAPSRPRRRRLRSSNGWTSRCPTPPRAIRIARSRRPGCRSSWPASSSTRRPRRCGSPAPGWRRSRRPRSLCSPGSGSVASEGEGTRPPRSAGRPRRCRCRSWMPTSGRSACRPGWSHPGPTNCGASGSSIIARTSGSTGPARVSAASRRWPPPRRRIGATPWPARSWRR